MSCRSLGGGHAYGNPTLRKDQEMPKINDSTYPQEPVLVDGSYPATLKEVKEYTKTYEGRESARYAWIFDVEADEDALDDSIEVEIEDWEPSGHYEIAAHTGTTRSTKANSNWQKLGMDVFVPADCEDTDELIGAKCQVLVSSFVGNDGLTKNTVEKIRPSKKVAAGRGKKKEQVEIDESDFDDIPL